MEKEISGKVVVVTRKRYRVMAVVLTLNREVMQIICMYGPQSRRPHTEKVCFFDDVVSGT